MPYRPMLLMFLTVALALGGVGLWIHQISTILSTAREAERTALTSPAATNSATATSSSEKKIGKLAQGTLLLAFLLICFLVVVGLAATSREWFRYITRTPPPRTREKTEFVDAWKIAGERTPPPEKIPDEDDGEPL